MKRSPMGKKVNELLDKVCQMDEGEVDEIATLLVSRIINCIIAGNKLKLPSAARAYIWASFHQLRCNQEIKERWGNFWLKSSGCPRVAHLALQLLLDRVLKQILADQAHRVRETHAATVTKLTPMESNAVRYMAGYVALKLLKQFKKPTQNPMLDEKRKLFVKVLQSMKAENQPGEPESVLDYTTLWAELIDRGGLYHINDQVIIKAYIFMHCLLLFCYDCYSGVPIDGKHRAGVQTTP